MIKANYCYVTHRGMHSIKQNIPENSLGAFKLAIQNKFAIHFEVQLSLENELINLSEKQPCQSSTQIFSNSPFIKHKA